MLDVNKLKAGDVVRRLNNNSVLFSKGMFVLYS
jgi:hypothetical protein